MKLHHLISLALLQVLLHVRMASNINWNTNATRLKCKFRNSISTYQHDSFLWSPLRHSHFLHLGLPQLGLKTARMDGHTYGGHSSCAATSSRLPLDIVRDHHCKSLQWLLLQQVAISDQNRGETTLHKGCGLHHTLHIYHCQLQIWRKIPYIISNIAHVWTYNWWSALLNFSLWFVRITPTGNSIWWEDS